MVVIAVGVGVSLKISQLFHLRVFAGEKLLALQNLAGNRRHRRAVGRLERVVVSVGAAASAQRTVAVGAHKTRIDSDFLNFAIKVLVEKVAEIAIANTVGNFHL